MYPERIFNKYCCNERHASCSFDLLVSTLTCPLSLYSSSLSTSSPSECGLTAPVPEPKPETQIKLFKFPRRRLQLGTPAVATLPVQ